MPLSSSRQILQGFSCRGPVALLHDRLQPNVVVASAMAKCRANAGDIAGASMDSHGVPQLLCCIRGPKDHVNMRILHSLSIRLKTKGFQKSWFVSILRFYVVCETLAVARFSLPMGSMQRLAPRRARQLRAKTWELASSLLNPFKFKRPQTSQAAFLVCSHDRIQKPVA